MPRAAWQTHSSSRSEQTTGWQIRSRTLENLYMDGRVFGPDRVELYPSPEPY